MAGGHRQRGVTQRGWVVCSLATQRTQGGLLFSVSEQTGNLLISETNNIEVTILYCITHLSCNKLSQHWAYGNKLRQEPGSARVYWAVVSSEGLGGLGG